MGSLHLSAPRAVGAFPNAAELSRPNHARGDRVPPVGIYIRLRRWVDGRQRRSRPGRDDGLAIEPTGAKGGRECPEVVPWAGAS
jgi:hypothetical protein